MLLVYIPAKGEGPETKLLGNPFNLKLIPNEPFEAADHLAVELLKIPQIKEAVTAKDGATKIKVKKGCKK